ncbi:MAG: 3'-5' exonuclease [Eudoraea sp.]|uniref:3'-5' exonuclease n=1 Tax=Eudoraea sp. TaxID=1979955 RepID=UPI003C75D170
MKSLFNKKRLDNLPEFWHNYIAKFSEPEAIDYKNTRFVVLDTETTGFNTYRDRILCIGALSIVNNSIEVESSLEIYLEQQHFDASTVAIHGILKNEKIEHVSEQKGLEMFLSFLNNAVIIAHHAQFDISMINRALDRNGLPELKNRIIDTALLYKKTLLSTPLLPKKEVYSLDEIANKFDISTKDRHTALGDAYITAIAFLKIMNRLQDKGPVSLKSLYN